MFQSLYSRLSRKNTLVGIAGAFIIIVGSITYFALQSPNAENAEGRLPAVKVGNVGSVSGQGTLSLVGTVASVSEVKLESEASGRVTRVNVKLGQTVGSGQIIATIENSGEYASLLQAQGSYEAALASAQKSDSSVNDAQSSFILAKQSVISTNKSSLNSWNNILFNTVDELFSNPRIETPGVRIDAEGSATSLNNDRVALSTTLKAWQSETAGLSDSMSTAQLNASIDRAIVRVGQLSRMVNLFITLLPQQKVDEVFTASEIARLQSEFATSASTLNSTVASLESAKSSLVRAEAALNSAEYGGTQSEISSANASLKQALGSLKAAESNYNKTIIRTPIGGTVNTLPIKAGDYVSVRTFVANIANNNASLITTYVGANDVNRINVGQKVLINNKFYGTVTAVATGIDPTTKKIALEIQTDTEGVVNGDTVSLSIETADDLVTTNSGPIMVPVSALKVETDRIVVFTVSPEQILVAHEIQEGPLQGTHIIVESGITNDMDIVLDARGLNEGDKVNVLN